MTYCSCKRAGQMPRMPARVAAHRRLAKPIWPIHLQKIHNKLTLTN